MVLTLIKNHKTIQLISSTQVLVFLEVRHRISEQYYKLNGTLER